MVDPVGVAQVIAATFVGMSILSLVIAVARRIAGPSHRGQIADQADAQRAIATLQDDMDTLRGEVEHMRSRVAELDDVQNRLDFAERLLAQGREQRALPDGKAP